MISSVTTSNSAAECPQDTVGAAPQWAAVVGGRLIPLPRRRLTAQVVLDQSGKSDGVVVRDYDQPVDLAIPSDAELDLAQGNVFRFVDKCDAPPSEGVFIKAPPKLAFVADDAWEITIEPTQSLESLRGLFDLPDDAELFRDLESPDDQPIRPGDVVQFADGPVFVTRITTIVVKVNKKEVRFEKRRVTGLEIKQTAIDQGVKIEVGFNLYPVKPGGRLGTVIGDSDHVTLKKCDEFRCVAPDDNS
jgi:hypothetical protein